MSTVSRSRSFVSHSHMTSTRQPAAASATTFSPIPFPVPGELPLPELVIRDRDRCLGAPVVAMPEAAVDENHLPVTREHEVRSARQVTVQAEPVPHAVGYLAYGKLWLGAGRAHPPHDFAALRATVNVSHQSAQHRPRHARPLAHRLPPPRTEHGHLRSRFSACKYPGTGLSVKGTAPRGVPRRTTIRSVAARPGTTSATCTFSKLQTRAAVCPGIPATCTAPSRERRKASHLISSQVRAKQLSRPLHNHAWALGSVATSGDQPRLRSSPSSPAATFAA